MLNYLDESIAQLYRWAQRQRREPFSILYTLFQPLIWLLVFSGLFQRVSDMPGIGGGSYTAFLTPGAIALTVFGNGLAAGIPVLFDKENGYLDRLLVAPIARSSIIVSRFLFVMALSAVQVVLILLIAMSMGVVPAAGLGGAVMIVVLSAAFGLGITALSLVLAFLLHSHVEFFALMSFLTLPLLFLSTALAPVGMMQPWLQTVVRWNPMTWAVDGMRVLVINGWMLRVVVQSLLWLILFDVAAVLGGTVILRRKLARA